MNFVLKFLEQIVKKRSARSLLSCAFLILHSFFSSFLLPALAATYLYYHIFGKLSSSFFIFVELTAKSFYYIVKMSFLHKRPYTKSVPSEKDTL